MDMPGLTTVSLMQIKLIILLGGSGLQVVVPMLHHIFEYLTLLSVTSAVPNPQVITQGQNFDEEGIYTKKWVPELSKIPNKYLFNPWEASPDILNAANLELGKDYPLPIVDIKESRNIALQAFETIKNKS